MNKQAKVAVMVIIAVLSTIAFIICVHYAGQAPVESTTFAGDGISPATRQDITPWTIGAVIAYPLAVALGVLIWTEIGIGAWLDRIRTPEPANLIETNVVGEQLATVTVLEPNQAGRRWEPDPNWPSDRIF